jgi:SWI/SNF-related matrix-associated actin-dependent regulator of chromatin subfamily A3
MEGLIGKDPMITPCGHAFCKACISSVINLGTPYKAASCPLDRKPLPKLEQLIELPVEASSAEDGVEEEYEDVGSEKSSAKVNECMKIVRGTLKRDSTDKILIFSNFVKFLDVIAEELKEAKIGHARFHGALDVKRRDAVLKSFNTPINARQSVAVQRNITRLEEKLQRERAAQKAAQAAKEAREAGGAPPSSDAGSVKSSSSLLDSLRGMDNEVGLVTFDRSKSKGKGKQTAQEGDIFGENPSVLLISMGCGALGLNLTVASSVLLMDPFWQSAIEQQAIDRVHRIGQTKEVKVFQIICENTVEARVLEIKAAKDQRFQIEDKSRKQV